MNAKKNNLEVILQRIEKAKEKYARTDDVKLIAVSKRFDAQDILDFYALGLRDFAENYIQEWEEKRVLLPEDIVWHIIGNVQSNKTKYVAAHATWMQTVDRLSIATRINNQRDENLPPINVCIEVNISQAIQKSGVELNQLEDLVTSLLDLKNISLRGLMCIPEAKDLNIINAQMQQMQEIFQIYQAKLPHFDTLSMGMSGDLESAIKYGATMVRIGTALFGKRK